MQNTQNNQYNDPFSNSYGQQPNNISGATGADYNTNQQYPAQNPSYTQDFQSDYQSNFSTTNSNITDYNTNVVDYGNTNAVTYDTSGTLNTDYTNTPTGVTQDFTQQNPDQKDTFVEKKAGNKKFLIIAVSVILVLIIGLGILIVQNRDTFLPNNNTNNTQQDNNTSNTSNNSNTPNTSNTDQNKPEEKPNNETQTGNVADLARTGGADTPASKARKTSANSIPTEWLVQKFTRPIISSDGKCEVISSCGPNADPDSDGLSNLEEYNFATDPLLRDTDRDNISDGDELFVYYSDPTKNDTDGDTFLDGVELAGCFDMIQPRAKFTPERLSKIASNVVLETLHEPTLNTLRTGGATQADTRQKGYISAKCGESVQTNNTNSPATNNSATTPSGNSSSSTTPAQNSNSNNNQATTTQSGNPSLPSAPI